MWVLSDGEHMSDEEASKQPQPFNHNHIFLIHLREIADDVIGDKIVDSMHLIDYNLNS